MKTFAFLIEDLRRTNNGYRIKKVTLWRVKGSDIERVGQEEYSFKDDGQAARELAEQLKLFKPGPRTLSGSHRIEHENGFTICGDARFKQL